MEETLMGYSWVVSEIVGKDIILDFSDDITKEEIMLRVGNYETEDVNKHKFKIKTNFSPGKLDKFQKKIIRLVSNEIFFY